MATKRLWSTLAPSTKAKYKRHGVTPQMYNSVRLRKENAGLFKTAQGKAPESYLMQRARELGAREAFPEFNMLPRAEKAKKAEQIIYAQETHKMVTDRAKYYGVDAVIPPFEQMTPAQQDEVSDLYLKVMDLRNPGGHINMDQYHRAKLQLMGTIDSMGYDLDIPDRGLLGQLSTTRF